MRLHGFVGLPNGRLGATPSATTVRGGGRMANLLTRSAQVGQVKSFHSGAESALSLGVGANGPEEVDFAEIRPERLAEIKFRVRTLPE